MTCVGLVQVERGQPAEEQQGGQGGRQPGPGVQPPQGDHHHHQAVTPFVIGSTTLDSFFNNLLPYSPTHYHLG